MDQIEFGLHTFGDVSTDAAGRELSHGQVIRDVVAEALLAERVGVDFFGIGEHHRADFAISSPEIVMTAIAATTKRIRVGQAATVLGTDDPVRLYQRCATLAAIAPGRVEIMVGRGWFTEAFPLFGFNTADYESLFDEKLKLLVLLMQRERTSWRGKFRPDLNQQAIYPRVEAGPLPLWVAVGATPASVVRSASLNLPMMIAVVGGEPQRFTAFTDLYRQAFAKLGRPAQPVGVHSVGFIAETDEQARDVFWAAYQPQRERLGAERGWPTFSRATFDLEVTRGSLYVGSPETVARKIAATLTTLSASRFAMKYSAGTLHHDHMMRCIELFGGKVVPLAREMLAATRQA